MAAEELMHSPSTHLVQDVAAANELPLDEDLQQRWNTHS
jgi:hypothetical protein